MSKKKKSDSGGYEDLYVSMTNVSDKRKSILEGIKSSLIMQEEHDNIMQLRRNKSLITKEIKHNLDKINKSYETLRKELPNVKNILSFTEKEINELEEQIKTLRIDTKANSDNIRLETSMKRKLEKSNTGINKMLERKKQKQEHKKEEPPKKPEDKKENVILSTEVSNKLSKLDRIQNNLKVIESKLKTLK